jgi:Mn2+/Fe2+ NRAMP family transporter
MGTTISPYLFFWQTSLEVEEMRQSKKHIVVDKKLISDVNMDVDFGMIFSGIIMFFIILTTGTVLFEQGIHQIDTVEQAALALKPVAGNFAYLLFSIGVISTGLIAIPVLSGSLSYIFAESFGWEEGLDKKFHEAKGFYAIIVVSLLVGLGINFIGISPIKALIYTAVLYGISAPVLIGIILHIANNKSIMGEFTNGFLANLFGLSSLVIMLLAAFGLLYFQFT